MYLKKRSTKSEGDVTEYAGPDAVAVALALPASSEGKAPEVSFVDEPLPAPPKPKPPDSPPKPSSPASPLGSKPSALEDAVGKEPSEPPLGTAWPED